MGKTKLFQEKLIRLPILLFTIIAPLLFIFSFSIVFASQPTANGDTYSTNEDITLVITATLGVLSNDTNVESGVAVLETAPPTGTGTVELLPSGAFTYTPSLDFSGVITFSYYVSKTDEISDVADVEITVTAVNDAPTASNDNATTSEETAVSIPVLDNDHDIDGSLDLSSVTIVTGPVSGTTGINLTTGAVTYTPTLNFNGNDSFVYQVYDDGIPTPALPVTATVYLTVTAVNDAPLAGNDNAIIPEETAVSIPVLANDSDVDGDLVPSSVTVVSGPVSGTTGINLATGAITYTPALNFNGNDSFVYQVYDDGVPLPALSVTATVYLTVTAVNDAPTASNDNATTSEEMAVSIPVLDNDHDIDGSLDLSSVTIVTSPVSGTIGINLTTGDVTYTPTLNFNGNDSFVYQVYDDGIPTPALSVTATVYLTVTAVNDAPTAGNDNATTPEDTAVSIPVLDNDNDIDDGDTISVTDFDATSSKGAAVSVNANGSYTYDPANSSALNALAITETTIDTFTYTISDSGGLTDTATVSITVTGVNDAPTAVDDFASVNEDNLLTPSIPGVLAGDTDPDTSDSLTAVSGSITSTLGAPVTINSTGAYTYNPQNVPVFQALNAGGSLQDTFSYTVTDGHGGNDNGIVTVTVGGSNDAPVIDNTGNMVLANINEDETNSVGTLVSAIISSVSGDRITDADSGAAEGIAVVGVTNINGIWEYSLNGSSWTAFGALSDFNAVLLDTNGFIRFVPNTNYNGLAGTISFRAWDQTAGGSSGAINVNVSTNGLTTPYSTDVETATLTVSSVNDAPVLDNSGDMFLTSIGEDNTTNPGDSVAAIVASPSGNRITDVDAGALEGIAVIGVDNSHGIWQYSINGGLNWSSLNVSPTSATLLDSQSRIRFVPDPNYNGSAGNITFRAWDQTSGVLGTNVNVTTNGGATAFSIATETAALNVYSINDAPFLDLNGGGSGNTGFGATFTEDLGPVRIVDTDLSISDVDNSNLTSAQAVLTNPLNGTAESLTVNTGTTGITAVYSPTTGILSLTGSVSLNNYQTVLRTLSYNNSSQDPNTDGRVVQVTVNDGTANSNLTTSVVSINAVNDNPILVNNTTLPVNEGGVATIYVARLQVTDVDDTSSEIVYTVISPPAHGDLLLSGTPLDTNDTFTQANVNGNALDYSNYGGEFTTDSFTFTVADGSGGSIGVTTFNISINADNDSPILATNIGLTLNEGATSTVTNSRLNVTDVDNTAVELTYNLEIAPVYGDLLLNGALLETNDTFTQADINSAKLAYAHDGSETISDTFTFAVEDGSGGTIGSTLFDLTINPVNDAPSVDLNGAAAGVDFAADFTEDGGPVTIADSTSIVFDADNSSLLSATAALANHPDGTAESLSANTGGTNISASYNPAAGVLTLSGIDSLSNYQTVLRSLQYNNAAQDPTVTNRIVNVTVNDGLANSNVASSTVTIHAVNDLPVLSANAGLTVDYGQTGIINNSLLRITDLDNSVSELVYTVKSLPVNGQLKRNGTPLAVNSTFTQADINGGLLAYTHNKTNTESDSFQFTAVDSSGGSISQKTFAIVIHPQPIVYLPVILNNYIYSEPNDTACMAFGVTFNTSYQFLPDDTEDWYKFTLNTTSNIDIQISNYASIDGQMIVYSGSNCASIVQIQHLPDISPGGSISLPGLTAGTYYVRVYTAVIPTNPPPYTLRITKP